MNSENPIWVLLLTEAECRIMRVSTYRLHHCTLITKKQLFSSIFLTRMFQMTNLRKCLWTLITRKWILSSMGSSMHLQITSLRKWIWTKITRKRFFSTMGSSVLLQIASLRKLLETFLKVNGLDRGLTTLLPQLLCYLEF